MSHVEVHGGEDPGHYKEAKRIVVEEARSAMQDAVLITEGAWKGRLVPGVRGYRTGHYARSITSAVTPLPEAVESGVVHGTVGTNVFYAKYLEYGTGLYGPKHQWITPKRGKYLKFPAGPVGEGTPFTWAGRRRSGRAGAMAKYVYAKRVRGIVPRRYARDAAFIAKPLVERRFKRAGADAAKRLGSKTGRKES
jgi:hypothetical protein